MTLTGENLYIKNPNERIKALEMLEKAKKLNRPERILPVGLSGEDYQKLKGIYIKKARKGGK